MICDACNDLFRLFFPVEAEPSNETQCDISENFRGTFRCVAWLNLDKCEDFQAVEDCDEEREFVRNCTSRAE